jgi:hypothetical protein
MREGECEREYELTIKRKDLKKDSWITAYAEGTKLPLLN